MNTLTKIELDKMEGASKPDIAIHIFVFNEYKKHGYDKTQHWIREALKNWEWDNYASVKNYLNTCMMKNEQLEPYKEELLNITHDLDYEGLNSWVHTMNDSGFNKDSIYKILSELFIFIQFNPVTENNDSCYDFLGDFLDRFTAWGNNFRILINEPDCE
jgi:hypothetical protein